MMPPTDGQLDFWAEPDEKGLNQWYQQRRLATDKLSKQLGLPLNRRVEIWLKNGICLKGLLKLREELLFVEEKRDVHLGLEVDGVPFAAADIESCVRLDD